MVQGLRCLRIGTESKPVSGERARRRTSKEGERRPEMGLALPCRLLGRCKGWLSGQGRKAKTRIHQQDVDHSFRATRRSK